MRQIGDICSRMTALTVLFALVIAGCAAYRVSSDFDSTTDFSRYRTFDFFEDQPIERKNPFAYKRLRRAVADELTAKGLTEASGGGADVMIALRGSTQEKIDVWTTSYGFRGAWRDVHVNQYKEGTLVIDIVDRSADELVWRGSATGVLSDKPGQDETKVREVVAALLKDYPPGAASQH